MCLVVNWQRKNLLNPLKSQSPLKARLNQKLPHLKLSRPHQNQTNALIILGAFFNARNRAGRSRALSKSFKIRNLNPGVASTK